MLTINGTDIELTRGDSLCLKINPIKNGEPYIPIEGDSFRFAMKKRYKDSDEDVVLVKDIPSDTLLLELTPQETKQLIMKKTYVYDIEYSNTSGIVDTFIKGNFLVTEEVY